MLANLENSPVATGPEKVSVHSIPKDRQCQRIFRLLYSCTHFTCLQDCAQNPSSYVSVHFSCVWLFAAPWTAASQASLSITNTQSLLKLMSIKSVMPSNYLILCHPFSSCLQSFPASGSFPMSQFFELGSQSTGASASASVFPMNIQD